MTNERPVIDVAAIARWLDRVAPAPGEALKLEPVSGGASNLTFRVRRGDVSFALRHPTASRNDSTANTFQREVTLLEALGKSAVPHARLIGHDASGEVAGVPFVICEWIDGFSPQQPLAPGFTGPGAAQALAWELTDALAKIGNEDYLALGLGSFGKPEGFLERQVDRWLAQMERARSRDLGGVDRLCDALRAHCPQSQRTALIHGDYQFINVMFASASPPRLAAVIDWEMATIGDPLLDLGWMLAGWQEPGEAPTHASYMDWTDMPGRAAVAERYGRVTGLDVSGVDYYVALALFKLAAIMEGWYLQYLSGRSKNPGHAAMETMVPQMIARALAFIGA